MSMNVSADNIIHDVGLLSYTIGLKRYRGLNLIVFWVLNKHQMKTNSVEIFVFLISSLLIKGGHN